MLILAAWQQMDATMIERMADDIVIEGRMPAKLLQIGEMGQSIIPIAQLHERLVRLQCVAVNQVMVGTWIETMMG